MTRVLIVAAIVGLALAAGAPAAEEQAKDTLQLKSGFSVSSGAFPCVAGTSASATCFELQGKASIPGLGQVTEDTLRPSTPPKELPARCSASRPTW